MAIYPMTNANGGGKNDHPGLLLKKRSVRSISTLHRTSYAQRGIESNPSTLRESFKLYFNWIQSVYDGILRVVSSVVSLELVIK